MAPLLLFDLRHNWVNILGVKKLLTNTVAHQFSFQKILEAILLMPRTLARFWYTPQTNLIELHSYCTIHASVRQNSTPVILTILSLGVIIWFIKQAKKPIEKTIGNLILFYVFGITLFGILGYSLFDHYLTGIIPILAFISAKLLTKLKPIISTFLILAFISLNLFQVSKANNSYGLELKNNLVSWAISQLEGEDYVLDSISKCHKENGLRYLLELTDNPPKKSFMDPNFFWLYRHSPVEQNPDKILLVTDKVLNTTLPVLSKQTFGAMNAYILDNSRKTYIINF